MDTIGSRIRKRRIELKLTQKRLADAVGVQSPSVTAWEGDNYSPNGDNLINLSKALGCSMEWISHGEMGAREAAATYDATNKSPFSLVPMVEQFYHAGNGDGMNHKKDPEFLKSLSFRRDWLEYEGFDPGKLKVAMVHGKSMEPTLTEADVILVDRSDCHINSIESGKIYALTVNGSPLVKRVYRQELGGLTLESDNRSFKEISIAESDYSTIEIIGRVVWSGGKVG